MIYNGDGTEQQQLQGVYQILVTEPYLNQNRGQTRHARGPFYDSSVSFMEWEEVGAGPSMPSFCSPF